MVAFDVRPVESLAADVLVVGGGAAGVAAAVTAARAGCGTVLVERYGFCGGGAVAGLSGTVCGLYDATEGDRAPRQVVWGFADEFVRRLEAVGGVSAPVRYGRTTTRVHEPLAWKRVADALLAESGVAVIFHATAVAVLLEGGERVEGVRLWTKNGPVEVRAPVVVDASGDADLVAMAGLPSFVGDDGRVQNPSTIFRLGGVDVRRFLAVHGPDSIMPASVSAAIEDAVSDGYELPRKKIFLFPTTRPNELLCNCTRVVGGDGRELDPLDRRDLSEAEGRGRAQVMEYARFFRDRLPGCERSFVVDTGVQVGIRQSRQIRGVERLDNAAVVAGAKRPDGIVRSPWPIELHEGEKPTVRWLLDDWYEVPYGCFVPERGEGLLAAGRCLSAQHEAVASARVTAQCFGYGHAVGHAAVLAAREGMRPREIPGRELRAVLNRDGARLDG